MRGTYSGTGTSSPPGTVESVPTAATASSTPRRLSPSDKRSSSVTTPDSSALTHSEPDPGALRRRTPHDSLGARALADFEADRRALLARCGLDEPTLRRAVETAKAGLDSLDRFGSANWDARLRATDQLFTLAGVYPSRASPTGGGTKVEVLVAAPEWLATMVKSK